MNEPALSRRERQIMDIVYARASVTADDVRSLLPDPPTTTAVRTLLRILEDKGQLQHAKRGRQFVYSPRQTRKRAAKGALKRVLEVFFEGSLEKALAAHLADPQTRLSKNQLDHLANLIRQAKDQGK